MNKIVSNFSDVIEWNEQQTALHSNELEIILARYLHPLKGMVTGFKMNYDSDKLLAYEMQQYCINGFDLMLIFIKDELLIRIENAPYFDQLQEVIDEYKHAIDVEDVKLSLGSKTLRIESQQTPKENENDDDEKIHGKYYALYHWILIELGTEKPFELNADDKFPKTDIINFASERYKKTSADMFYRGYRDIDITDKTEIARRFGKGYKDVIVAISNNDAKVVKHLTNFPN